MKALWTNATTNFQINACFYVYVYTKDHTRYIKEKEKAPTKLFPADKCICI